jgi:hypothetical protein
LRCNGRLIGGSNLVGAALRRGTRSRLVARPVELIEGDNTAPKMFLEIFAHMSFWQLDDLKMCLVSEQLRRKPLSRARRSDDTNGTSLRVWWSVRSTLQGGEGTRLPTLQRSPGASD